MSKVGENSAGCDCDGFRGGEGRVDIRDGGEGHAGGMLLTMELEEECGRFWCEVASEWN
jgi:hypothetical protein